MASVMYRNSTFELSQVFNGNLDNLTDLTVDSKIDSFGYLLNETLDRKFGEESDSRNVSSGKEVLNGSAFPGDIKESDSRNVSSGKEVLNGRAIPGVTKESDSRNISSQPNKLTSDFKFLQGLYSPELDERSCLSRYQSILYRKPSTHNPSPYLLSKLLEYEDLHKLCGPYTKAYSKASKRLKSGTRSTSSKCKYIIWVPANGLGNRIVSMAATFLYALLTNRVLLVDHGTDMADLFCEPFPNTSWLLPNSFPLKQQFGVTKIRHAHGFGSIAVNMSIKSQPTHLYLNLDHSDYDLDKKLFYCDKGESLLVKVTWLILLSDQYFAPSFFLSSSYKEEAWGLITRFYDAYLAKADKRAGLQVRVFQAQTTTFQIVMNQILACTMNEKILPETQTEESVDSEFRNKTSEAILVTSLHSEFYENLKDMYWTRSTVTGEVVGVYQASHEDYQHFGDNKHNMKAWVEMYLLSMSDVLVTSGFSTFGYVAQGLGGLRPWILYKTNGKKIRNPPCVRDISMEPCFHVPKIDNCQDKVKIDAGALLPYLRHCQDRKEGVKLVTFPEGL
ncbi:hypothetical protein JCGZ_24579 [Jatropha curcas]|uniref:Fucosyltransferase n=1 Tax=Jatropha curcas TaxID=180498 RepID=A0A067L7U9_JATCU|nr:hypothetical protein JCGZ_24579 [Jatropha curcas]